MKLCRSRFSSQCKLSQQDLRDISELIIQEYAPHETPHQPELVLMPVDPDNLYAYWNLKEPLNDVDACHIDKPLALRIYSLPEFSESHSQIKLSFDIRVDGFQNRQKVRLPLSASAYSAVIGELNADNSFSTLATSGTIHIPRKNPTATQNPINPENMTNEEQEECIAKKRNQKLQDDYSEDPWLNHIILASPASRKNNSPNSETTLPATFVVQNFQDYGYDLTIYQNPFNLNAEMAGPKQPSHSQLQRNKLNTLNNCSGLGR